jgi:hypothetical protein
MSNFKSATPKFSEKCKLYLLKSEAYEILDALELAKPLNLFIIYMYWLETLVLAFLK